MKKASFESLLDNMSHFLDFPEIESEIDKKIQEIVEWAILSVTKNGDRSPEDVLSDYLSVDREQKKLKIIVAMAGGSEEKLKRIVASFFDGASISKVNTNREIRQRVASFLIEPENERSFVPHFIRKSFQLPTNWIDLLKDKKYMSGVARKSMSAKYSAKMGFGLEHRVASIVKESGFSYEKGPVYLVDNKEVDLSIPNKSDPQIMIMVSYQVTTGSGQTTKANEQSQIYSTIHKLNRSRVGMSVSRAATPGTRKERIFINVVDGGGWIARKNDLEQLWTNCDYCYTYKTLPELRNLLEEY